MSIDLISQILVADPKLHTPGLEKSVVILIIDTPSQDGLFGIKLNHTPLMSYREAMQDMLHRRLPDKMRDTSFYMGGPHAQNQFCFLHGTDYEAKNTLSITEELRLTIGTRHAFTDFMNPNKPENLFASFGLHIWSHEQLKNDFAFGTWHILPYAPELVFTKDRENLWSACMRRVENQNKALRPDGTDPAASLGYPTQTPN